MDIAVAFAPIKNSLYPDLTFAVQETKWAFASVRPFLRALAGCCMHIAAKSFCQKKLKSFLGTGRDCRWRICSKEEPASGAKTV